MWYAKPSGEYAISSTEGTANILEMNGLLNDAGYTLEAQAGLIGCSVGEGALNPWRWQMNDHGVDTVDYSKGYGLFQFTPARGYIDGCTQLQGYAPNLSTTTITSGAQPSDGYCQTNVVITDFLGKWTRDCWRDYWSKTTYASLWEQAQHILSTYGNGTKLTQAQFATIDDIGDATLAFLACYEGPKIPDYSNRLNYANAVYPILSGGVTPTPPTPTPTPTPVTRGRKLPIWMMCRKIH